MVFGYHHQCTPRMGLILPCCLPFGKAVGLQILRCQRIAVSYYGFTFDAWTLKHSDFCNVGVYSADPKYLWEHIGNTGKFKNEYRGDNERYYDH